MNEEHSEDTPPLRLDADLVATLTEIFTLGYCYMMAGRHVRDDDLIAGEDGCEIQRMALDGIVRLEDWIRELYDENPQLVHDGLYDAGMWAYAEQEGQHLRW